LGEAPVCVIAGSKSDAEYVKRAEEVLNKLGVKYDVAFLSAHRNYEELDIYLSNSKAEVYIAIAGLAAHLPGYIASRTLKPVIGVPINRALGGLDSLLSIAQMPRGVPVACVGIDNPENGALLAAEILALKDPGLAEKIALYRRGKL
jgi:5-(carboxyamino)imidazole ribonucleotide mutase